MRAGSTLVLVVLGACGGSKVNESAPSRLSNTPPAPAPEPVAPDDPNKNIIGGKDVGPASVLIQLNIIAKNAKTYYGDNAAFDGWNVPLTPAAPCCSYPDHMCPVDMDAWDVRGWRELDVAVDHPHPFRYSLETKDNDQKLTVLAVGDLDCDGVILTYRLDLEGVKGNEAVLSNVLVNIARPTVAD